MTEIKLATIKTKLLLAIYTDWGEQTCQFNTWTSLRRALFPLGLFQATHTGNPRVGQQKQRHSLFCSPRCLHASAWNVFRHISWVRFCECWPLLVLVLYQKSCSLRPKSISKVRYACFCVWFHRVNETLHMTVNWLDAEDGFVLWCCITWRLLLGVNLLCEIYFDS